MWAIAFAIYGGCKWLTWRRTPVTGVPLWRHAAYLLAWPGLDAAAFLTESSAPVDRAEWLGAVRNVAAGIVLFFGIGRLVVPLSVYAAGWIGMIGLVLFLHFGLFALLSCGWRLARIDARPLINRPLASQSLAEFWGRRWNTAFRDLTHRFLFRPLTRRFGVPAGLAGGFVFSGLVHELVISWPAAGGWRGPTLFFAVQGAGILVERSRLGRASGLASGTAGRLFAFTVLSLPAPLLFHHPFVERIIVPFMRALGAL
jgi:alginate O-acetyltransferase complex protein AlgI